MAQPAVPALHHEQVVVVVVVVVVNYISDRVQHLHGNEIRHN